MTIEEMRAIKTELGLTNCDISKGAGVPLGTVQKIFGGATTSPRKTTIESLSSFLSERAPDSRGTRVGLGAAVTRSARSSTLSETPFIYSTDQNPGEYPRQGSYTLDDYYRISEDRRIELINGVIYDMASPYASHQIIVQELGQLFSECTGKHPECKTFIAPLDVQLDKDDRTILQPDVIILCDKGKVKKGIIYGAPDIVVEVFSPSTKRKDLILKREKYMSAGCREYWMVDPKREIVIVDNNEKQDIDKVYHFDDKIPIGISDGKCEIDFGRVKKSLEWLPSEDE